MARSPALVGAAIGVLAMIAGIILATWTDCPTLALTVGCTQPFLSVGVILLVLGAVLCLVGLGVYARRQKPDIA